MDEEEVYLVAADGTEAGKKEITWVKISDDGKLEYINWETIDQYSKEFDELGPDGRRTETHIICKLLSLVRNETRLEMKEKYNAN